MPPKVDAPKLANTNNSSSRLEINDKTKFDADRATPKPLSKQGRSKTIVDYTSSAASRTKNITVNIPKHSKLILDKGYETITKKHNSNTTNPTRVLDDANHAMLSAPKKIDKDVSEGLNAFAATVGAGSVIWNAYCLCEARKEGNNLKAVLKEVENKVKELSISKDPEDIKTAEVLHASIEFIEKAKDKTMFEGAGAALSILATVLVVAGNF
jgi:hypothetical protein